jgi:hypothetical protein
VGDRGGLVRISGETFERLRRYRIERGLPSLGDCVADLVDTMPAETP